MYKFLSQITNILEPFERYQVKKFLSSAGLSSALAFELFLISHVLLPGAFLAIAFLFYSLGFVSELWFLIISVLALVFGLILPSILVYLIRSSNYQKVRNSLTTSLEMICICTEFGSSIDDMIKLVSEIMRIVNKHQMADIMYKLALDLGRMSTRAEAWHKLQQKIPEADFTMMIKLIAQSDLYGASMLNEQRYQLDTVRDLRIEKIKSQAEKVRSKITLSIMLTILPSLFIMTFVIGLLPVIKSDEGINDGIIKSLRTNAKQRHAIKKYGINN